MGIKLTAEEYAADINDIQKPIFRVVEGKFVGVLGYAISPDKAKAYKRAIARESAPNRFTKDNDPNKTYIIGVHSGAIYEVRTDHISRTEPMRDWH